MLKIDLFWVQFNGKVVRLTILLKIPQKRVKIPPDCQIVCQGWESGFLALNSRDFPYPFSGFGQNRSVWGYFDPPPKKVQKRYNSALIIRPEFFSTGIIRAELYLF